MKHQIPEAGILTKTVFTSFYWTLARRNIACFGMYLSEVSGVTVVTSTQVFLGFPVSMSKCRDDPQEAKLPLHASHVAPRPKFSSKSCIHVN